MNQKMLYPLFFEPVYKFTLWGGSMLVPLFGRTPQQNENPVGEAWEIVDRKNDQSVVKNGPLAGKTLRELMTERGADIVGSAYREGMAFPLLIKLLDTHTHLSIQVHPDKEYALSADDGAEEKTEMWYILHLQEGAGIYAGLVDGVDRDMFEQCIRERGELQNMLQRHQLRQKELYFIKPGRLHAIGGGVLLFEVQNNSDTTFRVWDWNRKDSHGNYRKLHVEQALKCIDFGPDQSTKVELDRPENAPQSMIFDLTAGKTESPFRLHEIKVFRSYCGSTISDDGSKEFHILTATEADAIISNGDFTERIAAGASCLVPASFGNYTITPADGERVTILRSTAN